MRASNRIQARQWSRIAWTLALLFASLPVASRLFLGGWEFEGAGGLACLLLLLGTYFHILGRRRFRGVPDAASMLEEALRLAKYGSRNEAIHLLGETIRLSPRLWQAFQYRGELYLSIENPGAALEDFDEAIRLAPEEPHLAALRERALALLGLASPTEPGAGPTPPSS